MQRGAKQNKDVSLLQGISPVSPRSTHTMSGNTSTRQNVITSTKEEWAKVPGWTTLKRPILVVVWHHKHNKRTSRSEHGHSRVHNAPLSRSVEMGDGGIPHSTHSDGKSLNMLKGSIL